MQNKFFRMIDKVPTFIVFATGQSVIGLTWFIGALVWQIFTKDLSLLQLMISISGILALGGLLSFIVWVLWEEWKIA